MSDLGRAVGRIEVNTSQLAQARAQVNAFANQTTQAMSGVAGSVNKAQGGITSLAGSFRGLAGALGFTIGLQGLKALAETAVNAANTATAYQRQEVAARTLAGSQQKVNELLEAYDRATGGAVDKATALANITRLQATGFGQSAAELEKFVRAVRGISLAMGKTQDEIVQELQLAISNTSMRRLDQIGLSIREVTQRMGELRAANAGMTREMAFQEAVLTIAEEKYGALADSAAGQASGVEQLTKKWKDFGLALSNLVGGPVNAIAGFLAKGFDAQIKKMEDWLALIGQVEAGLRRLGVLGADLSGSISSRTSIGRVPVRDMSSEPFAEESRAIHLDWARGITELNQRMTEELTQQNTEYQRNRASSERDYQQGLLREAQDFATNRLRQEQDLADSIADVHRNAAKRDQRMAEDLAETLGDARADTDKRLVELEEDYQREREKRARDHRDSILDAAGRLDAKAVADAQRNFKRQEEDAKQAYTDQQKDLREQLSEREEEARKSYQRQLSDARAADAERLADMQANFAARRLREDEDRATALQRRAEDHIQQLAEMDRAHNERIGQIIRHAQAERAEMDAKAKEDLLALGVRNEAWLAEQTRKEEELEKLWDKFWGHVSKKLTMPPGFGESSAPPGFAAGGFVPRDMIARVHKGEFVVPASQVASGRMGMGGATFTGDVHVSIGGSTGMGAGELRPLIREVFIEALQEIAA